MSFERHSLATSLIAIPGSIGNADHGRETFNRSRNSSDRNSRATRYQPSGAIERRLASKTAPASPAFSMLSPLLPNSAHLVENTGELNICKSRPFNHFRTLLHSFPASPLFSICSPKQPGVYPGPHIAREISIISNASQFLATIAFSRSTARYDTMTPTNKISGAIRATA
jgi:hypothetical protein